MVTTNRLDQFQAGHTGHGEVGDDHVRNRFGDLGEGGGPIFRIDRPPISFLFDQSTRAAPVHDRVINHQDRVSHLRQFHSQK